MGGGPPHGQVAHGFTLMIPPSGCFNTDVSRFLYCFSAPVPLVRHSRWHLCLGSPGTPWKRLPGRARGSEPRAETAGREDLFRGTPPCLPQIHQPQEGAGAPCPVPLCKRKEVGPRALKPDSALQGTESSETWVRRHAGPHTRLGPSGWRPALETWLASVRDSREIDEGVHIPTLETAVRPGSGLSPRPPSRGRAPAKIRKHPCGPRRRRLQAGQRLSSARRDSVRFTAATETFLRQARSARAKSEFISWATGKLYLLAAESLAPSTQWMSVLGLVPSKVVVISAKV